MHTLAQRTPTWISVPFPSAIPSRMRWTSTLSTPLSSRLCKIQSRTPLPTPKPNSFFKMGRLLNDQTCQSFYYLPLKNRKRIPLHLNLTDWTSSNSQINSLSWSMKNISHHRSNPKPTTQEMVLMFCRQIIETLVVSINRTCLRNLTPKSQGLTETQYPSRQTIRKRQSHFFRSISRGMWDFNQFRKWKADTTQELNLCKTGLNRV
jgi:hypothetical protein